MRPSLNPDWSGAGTTKFAAPLRRRWRGGRFDNRMRGPRGSTVVTALRCIRRVAPALTAFALCCDVPGPAPAYAQSLEVVDGSGRPMDTIAVSTVPGTTKGRARFYVRQRPNRKPAKPLKDVTLFGDVEDVDVAITAAGTAAGASFTVPPSGLKRVEASVSDPPVGTKRGALFWDASSGSKQLAAMTVTRRPEEALSIAQAGTDGIVETISVSRFERSYDVVSTARAAPQEVRIEVKPFEDDRGKTTAAAVRVAGQPLDPAREYEVTPAKALEVSVAATLAAKGTYESAIRLVRGEDASRVALKVTRDLQAAGFELTGGDVRQKDLGLSDDETTGTFEVDIRETEARAAETGIPELRLTRKQTSTAYRVDPKEFTVAGEPPQPIALGPGEERTLKVVVEDLGTGEWMPTLRIPGGEGARKEASASIFVRKGPLTAGLWILLGVLVSFAVRQLWVTSREKVVARHELAVVSEALERIVATTGVTATEAAVVDALRSKLTTAYDGLDQTTSATTATAEATAVRGKLHVLSRWLAVSRAAREADVAPEDRPAGLAAAAGFLRDDQGDVGTVLAALASAEQQIAKAPRLGAEIDALQGEFERWREAHGGQPPSEDAVKKLDQARDHLDTDVAAAAEAYRAAWKELVVVAVGELRNLIGHGRPPGVGTDQEWQAIRDRVTRAVAGVANADAETALERYVEGYSDYLGTVAEALRLAAQSERVIAERKNDTDRVKLCCRSKRASDRPSPPPATSN